MIDAPTTVLELFEKHKQEIIGWLRSQGAGEDAEDLSTEVFMRCWRIAQENPTKKITKGYLFSAAYSIWVSHIRSRSADTTRTKVWAQRHQPLIAPAPSYEEEADILKYLTPRQAQIALYKSQGYSYPEISEKLREQGIDISAESCKRTLFSARYKVKKKLEEERRAREEAETDERNGHSPQS